MSDSVRLTIDGAVAVIVFSNPPVNTSNAAMRKALLEAVTTAEQSAQAAVLIGDHDTFISGSDVREFDRAISKPELPEVIEAIERSPIAFVAALDGYALGGGLELAFACDMRIGTPRLQVGLPEVSLGFLPGAGGIQRLTRLAGRSAALELILGAGRITGLRAQELGVIDTITDPAELLSTATISAQAAHKRRVIELPVPGDSTQDLAAVIEKYRRRSNGMPGVADSITLTLDVGTRPAAEGLLAERTAFDDLRARPEAAALRYLAFAERRAPRPATPLKPATRQVSSAAVIGAGAMGAGIARVLASGGVSVRVYDTDPARVEKVVATTFGLTATTELTDIAGVDLVIEAVPEDLGLKLAILTELETIVDDDCILASNTSYLDLDRLAEPLRCPERIVGLHFFNPAERMPLVEVVRAAVTAEQVVDAMLRLAKGIGKTAIIAAAADGFLANRVFAAYRRECEVMLQDGGYVDQIDDALRSTGFAMGPFEVADLSGLQIAWSRRQRQAVGRPATHRYVDIPDRLCTAGRFGRSTGLGYYRYDPGRGRMVDPAVTAAVLESAREAGVRRRTLGTDEIIGRALAALTNEAISAVRDGISQRPSDIDVAAVLGFGFPRHLGGPLWWSASRGVDTHRSYLKLVAEAGGDEIQPDWEVEELFQQLRAR